MSILVIGVNHRSAPLALLERVTLAPDAIGKAVAGLAARDNVREVAVLSTCNRTEVYAVTEMFHGAYADIRDFLCDIGHLAPDELHPYLFAQHDDAAVAHLFEVASGLDSAVIGESEILGQVRQAWEIAQSEGGTRGSLNLLFRHALTVGKRARTETGIGRGTASVSHAAVEMAVDQLGGLEGRRVLVVGAGTMGEGVAIALHRAGAGEILVANRSADRGAELADRVGGVAIGFDRLGAAIGVADLVLTCTGSGEPILTVDFIASVRPAGRPLLIVDIAVPRDVESGVAELANVRILDLDDLRDWADRGRSHRMVEAERVREIVREEVERFSQQATALQAAPLVTAMRDHAENVRAAELERFTSRFAALDDAERDAVDALTRSIIAKLLHQPSLRLKQQAGTPQGERNAAAVVDLFDLG
ncbi:MAG TPA: glutamyl-tRNA reductase [Ilumatobacteraceae bacterium]|nr:glutamyl-tRNA reductase [Ilumatobacteraceae bacterium]